MFHRPSPAVLLSTLALFVALGGDSLAQDGFLAAKKLLTGKQVKDGSLTGKDIRNRSLLAADFKKGALPAGPTGPAGPAGPAGVAGAAGGQGPMGPAGAKGSMGEAGAEGPTGPKGSMGEAGAEGPTGPKGSTGEAGAEGPTGPKGSTGEAGAEGPTGPKGDTGETGPTGPTGTVDTSNFYDKAASDARFLPFAGKAADANLFDGLDSTAFLRSGGKADNSDLLDGKDSTAFYTTFTRFVGAPATVGGAAGSAVTLSATCPPGAYAVSGGLIGGFTSMAIGRDSQVGSNGWEIYVSRIREIGNSNDVNAFVICASTG